MAWGGSGSGKTLIRGGGSHLGSVRLSQNSIGFWHKAAGRREETTLRKDVPESELPQLESADRAHRETPGAARGPAGSPGTSTCRAFSTGPEVAKGSYKVGL